MIRIELSEEEAQRFLNFLVNAAGPWLVTNPVIMQLVAQLQGKSALPPREQADGMDRAAVS